MSHYMRKKEAEFRRVVVLPDGTEVDVTTYDDLLELPPGFLAVIKTTADVKKLDVAVEGLRIVKDGGSFPVFELHGHDLKDIQSFTLHWDAKEYPVCRLEITEVLK